MKFCVITGDWADGVLAVYGSWPTRDAAHEWAKGETNLGTFRSYSVKPFMEPYNAEKPARSAGHCPPSDIPLGMEVSTS